MSESLTKPSLPTFSWIGHLKDDDRELLSSYGEFFPGHPGNVIIEKGTQQTEVFVVLSGELQVCVPQADGTEALVATVGAGETLGEISLFAPGPATATVTATKFSQLWRIADADLIQFMEDNPGAGNVLLRTLATILAQRLRQVDPEAYGLSTYAVVDSPELPPQAVDEGSPVVSMTSSETEEEETAPALISRSSTPPSTNPAKAPAEPPTTAPLKPADPIQPPLKAPGTQEPSGPPKKKLSTKTQAIPDPDDLEPI